MNLLDSKFESNRLKIVFNATFCKAEHAITTIIIRSIVRSLSRFESITDDSVQRFCPLFFFLINNFKLSGTTCSAQKYLSN